VNGKLNGGRRFTSHFGKKKGQERTRAERSSEIGETDTTDTRCVRDSKKGKSFLYWIDLGKENQHEGIRRGAVRGLPRGRGGKRTV